MKMYVAGQITGDKNYKEKFRNASRKLIKCGYEVFSPAVLPNYPDVSHEDYMHICKAMIDVCDAVYFLKDWQQSEGAKVEFDYAREKGKFRYFEIGDDKKL